MWTHQQPLFYITLNEINTEDDDKIYIKFEDYFQLFRLERAIIRIKLKVAFERFKGKIIDV